LKEFRKSVADIKALRIQGAQAVAKEGVLALKEVLLRSRADSPNRLLKELLSARNELVRARPTEPCLRNSLSFLFHEVDYSNLRALTLGVRSNIQEALSHLRGVNKTIAGIGSQKIADGMVVFTHCHSSTVMAILLEAKREKKRFSVHNTMTMPLLQGRKTAKELAAAGIPVTHFVDSAARLALKKADIMLIGADAITSEGKVANKIGSELFAEAAARFSVPVYSCTDSWKFDPESVYGFEEPLEERAKEEVWKGAPKGVTIDNHAFELVAPELFAGVITELGVYKPEVLVEIIRDKSPWMFRK